MTERTEQVHIHADQVFSHAGGSPRLADVFIPVAGTAPLPVVLWIHGGGWRFGDRHLSPDLRSFAAQSGLAIVSIDYRLSDEAKFPAPVEDVKTAVRWVRSVSEKFGFDPHHIGLWGSSAGGHLAACAALSTEGEFLSAEHAAFSSAVQAVVDGYGPTDFARIDQDRSLMPSSGTDAESVVIGGVLPANHPDSFESRHLGASVGSSPDKVRLADPVHYAGPGKPPFLILHGDADALIPSNQSRYLFDALSAAANDVTLVLFQHLKHGFFNNPSLADQDYGCVRLFKSEANSSRAVWSCDAGQNIPAMVVSFFQRHLTRS